MKYILVNTLRNNIIEKIIPQEAGITFNPAFYPSYLKMVEDIYDKIESYDFKYDEKTQSFIKITDDDLVDKNYIELLKENLELKIAIAELSEESDQKVLDLQLALAEIVEGGLI